MSDGRKRRKAKQARRDARRTARRQAAEAEEASLLDEVREALDAEHPLDMLGLVSWMIQASAPRSPLLMQPDEPAPPRLDELVEAFADVDAPETTALLAVIGQLSADPAVAARCGEIVGTRDDELPSWIPGLERATVQRTVRMTHVLNEGDDLVLGISLPGGRQLTCVVFIDHTMISEVGDAFFVPSPIDDVLAVAEASRTDEDITFVDISPADARAWIEHGLEVIDSTGLPVQSETWPGCRPLVQWVIQHLPGGGVPYEPEPWDVEANRVLLEDFFSLPDGRPYAGAATESLLEACLEFDQADPLRWSARRIDEMLAGLVPLDQDFPAGALLQVPAMLRAFVPFAHARSGIRQGLTEEALEAIADSESDYRDTVLAVDDGEEQQ